MPYPEKLVKVYEELSLFIPDPDLIKEVYEDLSTSNNKMPFPFWAQVWPSARALVTFLQQQPHWVLNKSILELGAGIGLPSFCIAKQAAELIISDLDAEAVSLIQKNIHLLALNNAIAKCIDWNDIPENINTEIVLMSDVNYAPDQFEVLLRLIERFLNNHATIILTTPQRITITPFAKAIQPFIKHSELLNIDHYGKMIEIRLLILSK